MGALALLLAGCSEDGVIVARVGEVKIEQAEFAAFVERLPPGLHSPKGGRAADREHLQSMIDEELMFAEARALGIDTSLAVAHQLGEMVRQRLVERYRAQGIVPQVEVTAEDVERAFAEMGFDRERLFSRILVRTREELEAVGRDLRESQPFEKVAARFATNDLFASQGDGVVGWIGRTQAARRFSIPPAVFAGLPVGQVAEPVALAGGYQVFRVGLTLGWALAEAQSGYQIAGDEVVVERASHWQQWSIPPIWRASTRTARFGRMRWGRIKSQYQQ